MSEMRKRIGLRFESLGHLIFRHRWIALILVLIMVGVPGSQLPKLTIDTSTEGFLHKDDPTILTYNDFRRQFGRDEFIVIAIESSDIFSLKFLNKLKKFHEELESNAPHMDDIISLVNARNTRGEKDQLIVGDLLENWPQTKSDLEVLKQRVLSNKQYLNRLISEDGRFTVVVIKTNTYSSLGLEEDAIEGFDEMNSGETEIKESGTISIFDENQEGSIEEPPFLTDQENSEVVNAISEIIPRYESPDFRLYLTGSPVTFDAIKKHLVKDMVTFMRLVLFAIGVCLFIMFRRITGVVFPFLIVILSLIFTIGVMAFLGVAMTLPTNILPSFILAVGVGASVHILAIFYQNLQKGYNREEAICKALGHSGLAILMTSLTTAAGLASFAVAELAPIAQLGIFASIGVLMALINTVILLPALLSIVPVRIKTSPKGGTKTSMTDRFLISIADFSTSHARSVIIVSSVLIIIAFAGITRITFGHDPMIWLPEDLSVRVATEKIDHELRGTVTLDIVVDTGRENGLYDIGILNKLDMLAQEMEKLEMGMMFVGKATSIADILKEIHRALNENRSDFYSIPKDPKVIPQEFLLFENSGSDDLEDVVDSQFSKARFTIKAPWGDSVRYMPFLMEIENRFKEVFKDDAGITTTGLIPMMIRTLNAAIHSMAKSYIIAFIVITFMMIILIGDIRLGLISMIPNLLPVILIMGLIGWLNLTFDLFTMLIGSIAIGLAVDDTVHFMHNFRRYHYESGKVRLSVRQTLQTAGRAMLVTTIVLSIGFFIFMFASMNNLYNFGLLTGVTIITALLADYLLAPALMVVIHPPESKI